MLPLFRLLCRHITPLLISIISPLRFRHDALLRYLRYFRLLFAAISLMPLRYFITLPPLFCRCYLRRR